MPSFWEHTRLDVLHVPGVATRVSTRSIAITCAPTSLAAPTAAAALPRSSLLPYIPQSKEQDRTTPTAHQKKGGIPKREPCPRVVRIVGNAFSSSKPRFDRGKIRLVQSYDLERDLHLSG